MCVIAFFLKAYLKNDFTANLLISSTKKIVTILQPLKTMLRKHLYIFRKFCEQLGDCKFWLYTVDLGDVCYND